MTAHYRRRLPFGATVLPGGFTRFRLWAPGADTVQLDIDGREPQLMAPSVGGWHRADVQCGAGTRYRYKLADGLAFADPASRSQAGDVESWSIVIDPTSYPWTTQGWCGRPWNEVVLYELHVGACGGFKGVTEKLAAIAAIGVTAIELMPIAEFPGARGWGYDGVLPFAPEAGYGTPDELKALIDQAHALELMVFLDVVHNHFGPQGCYLSTYAPTFFTKAAHTPWGAAIDFNQPQVREFFTNNSLYWLMEYRFDGLRFDAVHQIAQPDWLDEMAAAVRASVEPGRHVHLVLENEHNAASHLEADFNAQWNDDAHNALHVLLTGETDGYYKSYADRPVDKLARCLAEGFAFQGEPFPGKNGKSRGEPSAGLPPTAFVLFLQNHDQIGNRAFGERLIELGDPRALRAAVALQLLCPQIPLLFMGEEWGSRRPFQYFTSFDDELGAKVRDGRRREFKELPAFADAALRETIPDPNDPQTFEMSRPDFASDSVEAQHWRNYYRELLSIRHEYLVPRLDHAHSLGATVLNDHAVLARWRLGDGSCLSIACNLGDVAIGMTRPAGALIFETMTGVMDGTLCAFTTQVFADEAGA